MELSVAVTFMISVGIGKLEFISVHFESCAWNFEFILCVRAKKKTENEHNHMYVTCQIFNNNDNKQR